MKSYARYKDSGISWIGRIPEHWDVSKIRYIVRTPLQYGANESGIEYDESLPRYIRITDITMDNRLKSNGKLSLPEDAAEPYILEDGDILFARSGASVGKTFFYEKKYGYSAFAGYLIKASVNKTKVFPKYIYYNTLGNNYEEWKSRSFIQATIQNIGADKYNTYIVPIPPIEEQKSIAAYLDKKTEQLNELVAAKQKQIELLKEYKQSLIANAVTKGINHKAKMKDSGISWIGKVPEHWEIDKLGHRFIQRKEKVSDKDFEPLSVSKMGVTPQLESACKSDDGDNRKLVRKGDFVVNSRSDRKGSCGFSELDGSVSLINIVVTPRCDNGWYYHHLFRSNNYIEEFYRMGRGIVADLWTTRWSEMRTIMIPVPPIDEQKQIVAYINERVSSIDTQISSIEKQIANLNEYKQSLISDVVTGKVKV